jgi:antitoxin YefM
MIMATFRPSDRLIDQTAKSHKPIRINGSRANAVLLAAEDWHAIQKTPFLLAVPGMRESIKEGIAQPLEEGTEYPDWTSHGPRSNTRTTRSQQAKLG